ncbi:MAG: rod shape-determining protein MreC [Acidimicrobiales bacterium]
MLPHKRPRRLLPLFMATAMALLVLDVAGFGPIVTLRRTVLTIGQPIGVVLAFVVSPLTGTWNGAVHYDDVETDNHRLRQRVAELEGKLAGQADAEIELRALMAATNIDYLGDVDRVTARVVADRTTDFERVVEIDKGTGHGIASGMVVVTGSGLAGTVELVAGNRSVVRLISDVQVAVGIRSKHGLGLAVGTRDGRIALELTPELAEAIRVGAVADGERFVTSGVDRSIFPPGIPVGTLTLLTVPGGPAGVRIPADVPADVAADVPAGAAADTTVDPGTGELAAGAEPDTVPQGQPSNAPSPAGPSLAPDGTPYDPAAGLFLQPLAELDRLGYLTVLLIEGQP